MEWLNACGIDLLEISGGTYEQPRLLGYSGQAGSAAGPQPASTRRREAYFLEYAAAIRKVAKMPLMVTGGFRSRAGMQAALAEGSADVIGLGRPLCTDPDVPKRLLAGQLEQLPAYEYSLRAGPGIFSPTSKVFMLRLVNVFGQQGWYYRQLFRLAEGLTANLRMGVVSSFVIYLADEYRKAWRRRRANMKQIVVPAQAGTQFSSTRKQELDSRLRGNDKKG